MHNGCSLWGAKPLRPAVTFRSLAHLQHFTCQAIDDQLTTSDPEHVEVLLHIGETGWVGLKAHMAAGCDRNAVPVCLESTVGVNVFDGPLNVLGLTTSRVRIRAPTTRRILLAVQSAPLRSTSIVAA